METFIVKLKTYKYTTGYFRNVGQAPVTECTYTVNGSYRSCRWPGYIHIDMLVSMLTNFYEITKDQHKYLDKQS